MLIDWFTVAAQIINFLILVWLLKKFLYGRIQQAMETRENRIRQQLEEAKEKEEEAQEIKNRHQKELEDIRSQRAEKLKQAEEEADGKRKELIKEAKEAAESRKKAWLDSLLAEKKEFVQDLRKKTASGVFRIAQKASRDLADQEIEDLCIRQFQKLLLQKENKDFSQTGKVLVKTGFSLSQTQKQKIDEILSQLGRENGQTGNSLKKYVQDQELIFGIELVLDGEKYSFSMKSYLDDLEREFSEMLEKRSSTGEIRKEAL